MRLMTVLLCLSLAASTASGYAYWNDTRNSAELPDTTVTVRTENPTGVGDENSVLYDDGGIQELPLVEVADGPSTLEASVPGPFGEARHLGFRLVVDGEIDLMPVKLSNDVTPGPEDLTRLSIDPIGDELFGYQHLDLVDCHVSFSDTELHAALRNAGGGFPVSQLLTFFGYVFAIGEPSEAVPDTVFTMMQTYEQAGIISPGLYKVTGPEVSDLVKLGDVQVTEYPSVNTLVMTCQLADLMADQYFASWYDPLDPVLDVIAITQRITIIGGAQEADETLGGRCYLRGYAIEPGTNQLPNVSNANFTGSGPTATAEVDYADPNSHCPVLSEIVFDGTETYPLFPKSLDYGTTVTYTTAEGIDPLANGTWSLAVFRFSDNGSDVVELEVPATGIDEMPVDSGGLLAFAAPNPFAGSTRVELTLRAAGHARVAVHDLRGRLVDVLVDRHLPAGQTTLEWDGRSTSGTPVGSGVYFVRIETLRQSQVRKLVLTR